jgi:hypothetical protein
LFTSIIPSTHFLNFTKDFNKIKTFFGTKFVLSSFEALNVLTLESELLHVSKLLLTGQTTLVSRPSGFGEHGGGAFLFVDYFLPGGDYYIDNFCGISIVLFGLGIELGYI